MANYEKAIVMANRKGFLNDLALAHERFGEYCLRTCDTNGAIFQIHEALRCYREWGANGKVRHMENKYARLLLPPSQIIVR